VVVVMEGHYGGMDQRYAYPAFVLPESGRAQRPLHVPKAKKANQSLFETPLLKGYREAYEIHQNRGPIEYDAAIER